MCAPNRVNWSCAGHGEAAAGDLTAQLRSGMFCPYLCSLDRKKVIRIVLNFNATRPFVSHVWLVHSDFSKVIMLCGVGSYTSPSTPRSTDICYSIISTVWTVQSQMLGFNSNAPPPHSNGEKLESGVRVSRKRLMWSTRVTLDLVPRILRARCWIDYTVVVLSTHTTTHWGHS